MVDILESRRLGEYVVPQSSDFGRSDIYFKGGGSSGTIDYPPHMKTFHSQSLDNNGIDKITTSMADLVNLAATSNPYSGILYYGAAVEVAELNAAVALSLAAQGAVTRNDWDSVVDASKNKVDSIFSSSTIDAEVAAFTTLLDNDLDNKVYPQFEAGMRDINSVMSSAFPIGKALIVESRNAEVAKYDADLRHKNYLLRNDSIIRYSETQLKWFNFVFDAAKSHTAFAADTARIKVIVGREGVDQDTKLAELEGTWEFESFTYAGNFLASIGAGTSLPKSASKTASVLGGVASGAAAGAMTGNPYGVVIGGVIGGIAGALS